jgi:putative two-component system response regulator
MKENVTAGAFRGMEAKTPLLKEYESETGSPVTDSLTGLLNHGVFQLLLGQEIKGSQRYDRALALAFIGIDSFSRYNERYGSLRGDQAVKEVGNLIRQNLREADSAARYSGDVIAVLLTESDEVSALIPAERIKHAVESYFQGRLTVSVGVASYPQHATEKTALIEKAQEALAKAKIRGKNKVCVAEVQMEASTDASPPILIVDDDPKNLRLLEALLRPLNREVLKASDGDQAISIINKADVDLVLLDVMMPGVDGFEVCRQIKASEKTRLTPVIMVTALDDLESRVKGIEAGSDDFITKPANKMELMARTKSLLKLKKLSRHLASIENVLFSLANAVEANDAYTHGHVERVSGMALSLGGKIGLSETELKALRLGGALHDIGKIGLPSSILNKPGPLDPGEWEAVRNHPDAGHRICLPLKANLGLALKVIRHHHEKLDGSGYPDGLRGKEIPRVARVMAIVDIYDALVTDRPYRKGMAKEKAFEILLEAAEKGELDIEMVKHLIEMVDSSRRAPHQQQPGEVTT